MPIWLRPETELLLQQLAAIADRPATAIVAQAVKELAPRVMKGDLRGLDRKPMPKIKTERAQRRAALGLK